ncbi:MAG: hemolysin family protein [Candidatus Micrarchaeota archaeon]|nr:hemolysin family protein [Candidatus Micrarchaeota archaeon]
MPFASIVVLAALLCLSAFFSASEVAFLSISRVRLHALLERKAPGAESLARLREQRRKVIIAILIGNNIVNISASAIATSVAISYFGDEGVGIAIGVMTFLILTFGEIAPKSFATSNAERWMLFFAPALEILLAITSPLVFIFEVINRLIPGVYSRATGVEQFTEEEVRSAIKLGAKHRGISERERELLENVLEFNDRTVAEAMTPKSRVVALDGRMRVAVAHRKVMEEGGYSRYPVIMRGKVIGTVSVRILGRALYEHPDWPLHKIAWHPVRLKTYMRASEAFAQLQKLGRNIAIVENEKGEFAGVVTLEDLLEELVGEIQ